MRRHLPVLLLATLAPAQQAKDLQLRDLLQLDYAMLFPFEVPQGFVDAAHYLAFDAGRDQAEGQKGWWSVEARTGKRTPLGDRAHLEQELQAAGVAAEALTGLDELERYCWNAQHDQLVVDIGDGLFVVERAGKVRRLLQSPGDKHGAQFSPDGQWLACLHQHELALVPAAGGAVRTLTKGGSDELLFGQLDWVYQEEVFGRGNFQGFWWSPDSQRIALLRLDETPVQAFPLVADAPARPKVERTKYPKTGEPNPKVDLGIADVASGAVRWFELPQYPSEDRLIVRVTWAPDGKEVWFSVQNRTQTFVDLLAGDAATGAVRRVFHEASDCWVEPGAEPKFLHGGAEFLWLSEGDGCCHVYRYRSDGKLLGRLTAGDWQVKQIEAIDEPHGLLWFTADKSSPLQTHLYTVPLQGGEVQQVTKGRGTHDITMAPDCASFVSQWSSAVAPLELTLCAADGSELRSIAKARTQLLRPYRLREPEFVQIKARDGFAMEAMLIKPGDFATGKQYPVVQFVYAGPHSPVVRDGWGSRDYLWHQMLAQKGYLVFVCDNRSASGKGRKYAKACWQHLGSSELQDLSDGVQWLIEQRLADPARVMLWGWSYGGYQTLFNLTHSELWQCGIAVNAVTDWRNYDTIYTERYHGLPELNAKAYQDSSVVAAAAQLHGSLLLVCAAMDDNVHMQNSLQLLWALQQAGKDCDFMVYPRARHGIDDLEQQLHLFARMTRFVEQHL